MSQTDYWGFLKRTSRTLGDECQIVMIAVDNNMSYNKTWQINIDLAYRIHLTRQSTYMHMEKFMFHNNMSRKRKYNLYDYTIKNRLISPTAFIYA